MVARRVLGVVLTAAVLTACGAGSGGQPSHLATTPASSSTVAGTIAACAQQYHAWQNGPAHSAIINFEAAQEVLDKNSSGKPALIAASLNVLGQRAAALASFPVPSCADPRGIFAALLSQIVTVADEVGPDATLADLQQAISQLGSVFSLESDFTAEVKQTTGT
jgi:hypothetical protein